MALSRLLTFLAKRFVAGETAAEAVEAARAANQRGIQGMIDFLGEHVQSAAEARTAVEEYLRLLKMIAEVGVGACLSLKASQMGLSVSTDLCLENLQTIARRAGELKNFVWIDMEGSALTEKTITVFERLRSRHPNAGLCLQACLKRTATDLDRLLRSSFNVRLCKGAYKEPPDIALADKRAVNDNFRFLARRLIERIPRGVFPAFATHDRILIADLIDFLRQTKTDIRHFEFQMLYGIQKKRQEALAKEGYQTRVYIPYGRAWLPYFLRRLGERKENIYFLMRNVVHGTELWATVHGRN